MMDVMYQTKINYQQLKINKFWYAIYVKSRHEQCVHSELQEKGIKSSLPLKTVYRQWSDRKKKIQLPLFRGYVFVKINIQKERLDVLKVDGVVKFITFGGRFITIPEEQMDWLYRLLPESSIEYVQEFPAGFDVEVTYGPFKGLCGKVKQKNSVAHLVVWFDAVMQGVSIKIDSAYLKEVKRNIINTGLQQLEDRTSWK